MAEANASVCVGFAFKRLVNLVFPIHKGVNASKAVSLPLIQQLFAPLKEALSSSEQVPPVFHLHCNAPASINTSQICGGIG